MQNPDQKSLNPDRLSEALRLIGIAQNQRTNVSVPDHQYLKMIKDFFGAEAVVTLFMDLDKPGYAVKKEFWKSGDWKIINNLSVDSGILWSSIKTNEIIQIKNLEGDKRYFPSYDGILELKCQSLTVFPLTSHAIPLGSIGLINLENGPLDDYDVSLLALFATKLADHLFYHKMINEIGSTSEELRTSKVQLLNSRNILRTLFDNIPEAFYIIDRSYKVVAINQARALRVGKTPKEIVGRICFKIMFDMNGPCPGCLVGESFQTSTRTNRTDILRKNDFDSHEWDISTFPILENDGNPLQVILLEQDITEKRKLEAELIQGEKLAAVGQLAAGIVHEINNPLTTVLANAQMLLQDIPPEQIDMIQSVKLIEMATIRANQVVKNILGLVQDDNTDLVPIDINDSMQNALMLVSHEFLSRKISVRFDRGDTMPLLTASANHLQAAWVNLLMNSIESIGTNKGEIKVTTHYENSNFYIEIRDSGKGISEENLDKIFEPFFSTKDRGQATGLGLSLVRRIIQAHGGQIMVESSPEKGARFTIILPEHYKKNLAREQQKFKGLL